MARKFLTAAATFCACLCSSLTGLAAAAPQPVNAAIEWNRVLLQILRTPGAQPPTIHSTRSFAILHIAIFDAVNNIDKLYQPYATRLIEVSPRAYSNVAASQAAHDVLVALYPNFKPMLDAQLQADLLLSHDGTSKNNGINVGADVAAATLALRSKDGSEVTLPPFVPRPGAGNYQLTPPNFAPADFIQWAKVKPFAITQARQFRPAPPPALTSAAYTDSFNEVASLGIAGSDTRTADQTLIGQFWNGNIQDFWNEIAQNAAIKHQLNLPRTAYFFALLNISLADTTIAFFDAKYAFDRWRPVTAIQMADLDRNPNTEVNPAWLPLSTKTAPDPSYPGAHSAISAAAAEVINIYFGDHDAFTVTSESLPGVTRRFTSYSAAAEEAGLSRIYAGQHFHYDHDAGKLLGQQVAAQAVFNVLFPGFHP